MNVPPTMSRAGAAPASARSRACAGDTTSVPYTSGTPERTNSTRPGGAARSVRHEVSRRRPWLTLAGSASRRHRGQSASAPSGQRERDERRADRERRDRRRQATPEDLTTTIPAPTPAREQQRHPCAVGHAIAGKKPEAPSGSATSASSGDGERGEPDARARATWPPWRRARSASSRSSTAVNGVASVDASVERPPRERARLVEMRDERERARTRRAPARSGRRAAARSERAAARASQARRRQPGRGRPARGVGCVSTIAARSEDRRRAGSDPIARRSIA